MLHIPLLRRGRPYRSLDTACANHHATSEPFVEISQANVGLIRRDLLQQDAMRKSLVRLSTADLIDMTRAAAPIFLGQSLPIGDAMQSPEDYVQQVWRAVLCHKSQSPSYGALEKLTSEEHVQLWGLRSYYRVFSLVNGGRRMESDLFEGVE